MKKLLDGFKRISWLKLTYVLLVFYYGDKLLVDNIQLWWVQMFFPLLFLVPLVVAFLPSAVEEYQRAKRMEAFRESENH